MNEDLVIFPALLFLFGFVVWMIFTTVRRYKTTKLQADIQNKLIDKFGSSQELFGYVQSEAGRQFLNSLIVETKTPYGRILSAVQAAVLLTFLVALFCF